VSYNTRSWKVSGSLGIIKSFELSPYVSVLLYLHLMVFPCHIVIVEVKLNSKALFGKGVGVSFVTIHHNFSKKSTSKHSNFFTFYITLFTFYYYSNKKITTKQNFFSFPYQFFTFLYQTCLLFFHINLHQLQYLSQSLYQTPPKSDCHYI
jgi:hypothetical protein